MFGFIQSLNFQKLGVVEWEKFKERQHVIFISTTNRPAGILVCDDHTAGEIRVLEVFEVGLNGNGSLELQFHHNTQTSSNEKKLLRKCLQVNLYLVLRCENTNLKIIPFPL